MGKTIVTLVYRTEPAATLAEVPSYRFVVFIAIYLCQLFVIMTTAKLSGAKLAKILKGVRALVPYYKETGEDSKDAFRHIERKFDHEFQTTITSSGIKCVSGPPLEKFASGVMAIMIGRHYDKLQWIRYGERRYDLTVKLGEERLPAISEGVLLSTKDYSHVTKEAILKQLEKYKGLIEQRKPTCNDCLVGQSISEMPKDVHKCTLYAICYSITLKNFNPPLIDLDVLCGAKFHLRTFTEDFGRALGTEAHIAKLHRRVHGPFQDEDAIHSYAVSWKQFKEIDALHKKAVYEYTRKMQAMHGQLLSTLSVKAPYRQK